MKYHVCRESRSCTCYSLGLEPDESCPQHGAGEWPPRCCECGRFLKQGLEIAPEPYMESEPAQCNE